jgi:GMP synthase-like glutamine amidotransferase
MSHFDKLVKLPEGFTVVASTANSEFAGIAHKTKPIYGASHCQRLPVPLFRRLLTSS